MVQALHLATPHPLAASMILFIRQHTTVIGLILMWVIVSAYAPPLAYLVLPLSIFLMRRRDMMPEILFGFLICLVLSDAHPFITALNVMKTAKYTYILSLALIMIVDQERMKPLARIFPLFTPFFFFSLLLLVRSTVPYSAFEKTLS